MCRSKSIAIVGAGGFGREIYDLLEKVNRTKHEWDVVGFVATERPIFPNQANVRWLGSDDDFLRASNATHFVVAITDPGIRRSLADLYEKAGLIPATLIHPNADIGSNVSIGPGSVVCSRSNMTTDVVIGRHVIVDRLSSVAHDVEIGDYATIYPASVLSGGVKIEEGVCLGTRSCILPFVTVRSQALVGAGAVVTKDVPEKSVVVGVPAQKLCKR